MTANVHIKDDDKKYFPCHLELPLSRKYCEVVNENEDVRLLCQDCMCHHFNKFCIRDNKKNAPLMCRVGFGDEQDYNCQDTPGMDLREESVLEKDKRAYITFE